MCMSTQSHATHTYSIRDASRLTGLPSSTLRYYESIGIVNPVQRGETSKHRVYNQAEVDMLDTISCLNATGMKLEDMKTYIANLSDKQIDTYEQVALLKAQEKRLNEEERHIKVQQEYVALKIDYWKARESGNEERTNEIAAQARALAKELKKV